MPTLARAVAAALLPILLLISYATPAGATTRLARPQDRPSAAELDKRIAAAARQLEVVVEQYNSTREDLAATRRRARDLGAGLTPLTRELDRRQDVMDGLMAQTYQRTRTGAAVALFAADRPHEFVDRLLVLHELAARQEHAVADLDAARTQVLGTRAVLNTLAAKQRRLQTQINTRKAIVQGEITTLKKMRSIAYADGSRYAAGSAVRVPEYVPGPAGRVVDFAYRQLGKPYLWGAEGPGSYDCSGLTLAAWRTAGVGLPHNAARQYGVTARLSRSDLRPGDLVFFYSPISHVGVYIGGGRMIHAPEFGENVRLASIDTQPIQGYGRPG
ncbi:C40 family peptidase [Actinoplanes sp. N902-109]|uniref:C40 family peptidase n=1 Tax=Actinoplanes sp. (strain N902-109) TaxID=649831 RepID=UPI00032959A2|nr:C40 family peptidase [Actinoplanes sp. N902-109]AGL14362.1 NLP/P60 protein [Actinoplanes sp. N902-109]